MKLLKCKVCKGEIDIVGNERVINKKVKCRQCGFSNEDKAPEVFVIRKKNTEK